MTENILRTLRAFHELALDWRMPSRREVGAYLGVTDSCVSKHVDKLVEAGLLARIPNVSRGTRLTPKGRKALT